MKKQKVKCFDQFQLLNLAVEEQKKIKGGTDGDAEIIIIDETIGS